jgi:glucosamine 6-phosphate synthetase-like amidotransferase/phosphosugar isomerase protein
MCGIFGSNDREQFFTLYKLNHKRGSYSYGCYYFNDSGDGGLWTYRQNIELSDIPKDRNYYLGHVRSPTNSTDSFQVDQCHPFAAGDIMYAHNGIISNTADLEREYKTQFNVDSKWIGFLYDQYVNHDLPFISLLQKIKGTYAIWTFNRIEKTINLMRCANPIYYSEINNSFSSTEFDNSFLLKEGTIYFGDHKQIKETSAKFSYKSPYFIPGN